MLNEGKTIYKEGSQASDEKDSSSLAGSNQEDKQKDFVLEVLRRLPEKWDRSKNAMELRIIADSQDTSWVAMRVFQDVERGLIRANFIVKRSKYSSCEMVINIESIANIVADNTYSAAGVVITALNVLLRDIKFGTILRRNKKNL
jgi:hypothetical protein